MIIKGSKIWVDWVGGWVGRRCFCRWRLWRGLRSRCCWLDRRGQHRLHSLLVWLWRSPMCRWCRVWSQYLGCSLCPRPRSCNTEISLARTSTKVERCPWFKIHMWLPHTTIIHLQTRAQSTMLPPPSQCLPPWSSLHTYHSKVSHLSSLIACSPPPRELIQSTCSFL